MKGEQLALLGPKTVRKMTIGHAKPNVPTGTEISRRVEMFHVLTRVLRVAVHGHRLVMETVTFGMNIPSYESSSLVQCGTLDELTVPQRRTCFKHGTDVWWVWIVSEGRKTSAADDRIKFCKCTNCA